MIQIKNAKELDGMRRANALSAAALKYGGQHIEAGMTTWELDKLIYDFIVKHGGTPNFKGLYGFPGTACISLNDTIIHGIPSHDIVIRPGDIVSIDTGAKVDGFNGDNACTYAVGKIDLEAQRLLDVTRQPCTRASSRQRPATASVISAMRCRATARTQVSPWSGSSWATAPAVNCTRTPRCPTTAIRAAAPALCPA